MYESENTYPVIISVKYSNKHKQGITRNDTAFDKKYKVVGG